MPKPPPAAFSDVTEHPASSDLLFEPLAHVPDWRHAHLVSVGSTNECLSGHVRATGQTKLWLTADRQTAGKGRRGRPWVASEGNLNASAAFAAIAAPERATLYPFAMALAVREALCALSPQTEHRRITLKWPNDVLIDGAKCAGLLLERNGDHIIAGFGVNIAGVPDEVAYPAAPAQALDPQITARTLFDRLAVAVAAGLDRLDAGADGRSVIAQWRQHAHALGQPATIRLVNRTVEGRLLNVDDAGYLLVETAGGPVQRISAGDVFFSDPTDTRLDKPI